MEDFLKKLFGISSSRETVIDLPVGLQWGLREVWKELEQCLHRGRCMETISSGSMRSGRDHRRGLGQQLSVLPLGSVASIKA